MSQHTDELKDSYDVVVIGGGAAGLNGAMMLGRSRRSVAVIDGGQPRNAPADAVHGLFGHDGTPPAELLARGREEVRRYGGHVVDGEVAGAVRTGERFTVTLTDGRAVGARRLLVATGLVDVLPDLAGLRERWGRDVVHCPYCHGWEVRDRAIGILATGPNSVHQALLFRQLSADVTYLTHLSRPEDEQAELMSARGIEIVDGKVAGLEITDDRISGVRLADDTVLPREVVAVGSRMVARAGFLEDLGLKAVEHPSGMGEHIPADPTGRTDVAGIWVAGNVTDLAAQVGASAAAGALAGAQINADLVMAEAQQAVDSRRTTGHDGEHPTAAGGPDGMEPAPRSPSHPAEFWESFYGGDEKPWSGKPNQALVSEVGDLPVPDGGTALDLGCGAGADAIWLAGQGWDVTGVDIARAALDEALAEAAEAGVSERTRWLRRDLNTEFPEGSWDLVAATYLHSPVELAREEVLRRAAAAVAPGGTLVVIGHQGPPSWQPELPAHVHFPTTDEVIAAVVRDGWRVERAETVVVPLTAPDGTAGSRTDNAVRLRRC
ncbi:FAD-dependent oxidoreductase [Nocardioides speluncae]|uniref:FAD-dependent oxidoreductase n=1 Tax=Nocardioides speluncae TaxID=2670337 RepID=UPI000D696E4A|nr:FAD-dependent oxidoreductase [Nocardioides speluncae]